MRITSLALRNFKAIGSGEQRVNFSPITLLYGPNSAGKSTIVQALHYLSEILSRNNCDPGTTQIGGKLDLGGFRNLVHLHDTDATIELGLGLSLEEHLLPSYGGDDEDEHVLLGDMLGGETVYDLNQVASVEVRLTVRWSGQLEMAYVSNYEVGVNGEALACISATADEKQIVMSMLNCEHAMFNVPLTEDEGSISVGDGLQRLVEEYVIAPVNIAGEVISAPLQLQFGRGAMPVFGGLLPLTPGTSRLEEEASDPRQRLRRWRTDRERQQETYGEEDNQYAQEAFSALNRYLSRIIVGAGELAQDCLQQFIYLGPLRDIPGRHYSPELSPGLARWSSGLGAWDQLYNEGETLAEKVNAWLADDKRLDAGYEIHYGEYKPLPLDSALMVALRRGGEELLDAGDWIQSQLNDIDTRRQVTLRDQRTDIDLHPEDLGTGISQVLPVLVAALGHNKNIIAIEQPELHLHPKFQVALGELFIHAVKDEHIARDTVFILETHSEYMMLRLLRRLYETANNELEPEAHDLTPEDISVYYVNPTGDTTEIVQLRLTEEGEFLDRWPNGFFPERKKELF